MERAIIAGGVVIFHLLVIIVHVYERRRKERQKLLTQPWPLRTELPPDETIREYRSLTVKLNSIFSRVERNLCAGVTTAELDELVAGFIRDAGVQSCFLGYNGYPNYITASIDDKVINTPPGMCCLTNGQILSLQVGIMNEFAFAYQGWSYPIGDIGETGLKLMRAGREALQYSVVQVTAGVMSNKLAHTITDTANLAGFSAHRDFTGHRMGRELHEPPAIPCYAPSPTGGNRLIEGMIISLQAIMHEGDWRTMVEKDGWSVRTADGKRAVQFSMMLVVHQGRPECLTRFR